MSWEKWELYWVSFTALKQGMQLTNSGCGTRLREAVRNATDGTISLLSRSLQSNPGYIQSGNHDMSAKSPHRRKSSVTANNHSYPSYGNSYADANGSNNTNGSSNYLPSDSQMTHQPTPYP